jgi:hypothetical protein
VNLTCPKLPKTILIVLPLGMGFSSLLEPFAFLEKGTLNENDKRNLTVFESLQQSNILTAVNFLIIFELST